MTIGFEFESGPGAGRRWGSSMSTEGGGYWCTDSRVSHHCRDFLGFMKKVCGCGAGHRV